jgi:hypothetical protein
VGADGALELAEFSVDAGKVQDDFREAHDGHIFGADDELDAGGCHAWTTHSPQLRCFALWSKLLLDGGGKQGAVVLAAGFACRDEDDW